MLADRQVADGTDRLFIEQRGPRGPIVRGLPHPASRETDEDDVGCALDSFDIVRAAAHHSGADRPVCEALQNRVLRLVDRPLGSLAAASLLSSSAFGEDGQG